MHINQIISVAIIGLMFVSCQPKKNFILSGEINHADSTNVLIYNFRYGYTPDTIKITNGKFLYSIDASFPEFIYCEIGKYNKQIFISPGSQLQITFDNLNVDSSLVYSGKESYNQIVLDSINNKLKKIDYRFIYSNNLDVANKYIDSLLLVLDNYFIQLQQSHILTLDFVDLGTALLSYRFVSLRIMLGLQKNIKDSAYYSFLKRIDIENEKYLGIPSYLSFIEDYIYYQMQMDTSIEKKDDPFEEELQKSELLKNNAVRNYVVYSSMQKNLNQQGITNFNKYYTYFKQHNTDSIYAKFLAKLYDKKMLLASGKLAPDFTCADSNNIMHSLSDFKGKYVYIDFWATWCGPCRNEAPYFVELYNEYKDKNIEFISISLDNDPITWKNFINNEKSQILQLIVGKNLNSGVLKKYQINGIPTFVLIDPDGKIINVKAPRPSSNQIKPLLDNLLNKNL